MKFSNPISSSIFILLICTTCMAIAGVRGFSRIAPEIEKINVRNTQSLYYTEKMLSEGIVKGNIKSFEKTLSDEKSNITEKGESEKIKKIENEYKSAFNGNLETKTELIKDITDLSEINRIAMKKAVKNSQKLKSVGSWVIIFMLGLIWAIGLIILKNLNNRLIKPLKELSDVFDKLAKGNKLRRCPTVAPTKDFQKIYDGINKLLDK